MTPAKKIYIILGVWIIFAIIFVFFVISPILNGIRSNKDALLSSKKEIASINAELGNLQTVRKQYEEYSPNLEKIDSLLVNSEVPIDFIRFLEKLASGCGVSVRISSGRDQSAESQRWTSLYYQLHIEGSYLKFSRFLDKLENSDYLIEVQDMNIRSAASEGANQESVADFSIKVFAK